MNIFAHFNDIDSQCTQQTIHNKLFLLIINQFHWYYYQCDHYIAKSIERVVMHFFKKFKTRLWKARLCFRSYTLHHRSFYRKMQCVRTVNIPCSSTVVKSLGGFSYVVHFRYRVDHCRLCNDNHRTLHVRSQLNVPSV